MNAAFPVTPQSTEDLDAIWWFIAEDNRDAADRVEREIVATCRHPPVIMIGVIESGDPC
jgi:plasmid stabilization system protein ParE